MQPLETNTPFTPKSRFRPGIIPLFLHIPSYWLPKESNPGRVRLDCCMTRDQPAFNPGPYSLWIARSAHPGYYFGTLRPDPAITQDISSV